jgi:hypothetical protein
MMARLWKNNFSGVLKVKNRDGAALNAPFSAPSKK